MTQRADSGHREHTWHREHAWHREQIQGIESRLRAHRADSGHREHTWHTGTQTKKHGDVRIGGTVKKFIDIYIGALLIGVI